MQKSLEFVPSAYRDWTLVHCEYAWRDWVSEFKRQFDWGLTDLCFVWNGNNTVMYRAPEEHLLGLYDRFQKNIHGEYLTKIAKELKSETLQLESFYGSLRNIDLSKLSWEEFGLRFDQLSQKAVHITPKMFISMYLPQALESTGNQNLLQTEGVQSLIKVRGEIDHIVAPLADTFTTLFCQEVLRRIGLPVELGRFISIDEVRELVRTEGMANIRELERKLTTRSSYFLVAGGRVQEISLEDYLTERGWRLRSYDLNASELKGTVAYKGDLKTITGSVVLVLNKRQLTKVQQGDIMISPMTTPEYSSIFKKISAIITDEGGITCHAAITAREMQIPTIIGTNVASKILKDGDCVELDLQTGRIRLL